MSGEFEKAIRLVKTAKDKARSSKTPHMKAEAAVNKIDSIVEVCEAMGMEVTKAQYLITQAKNNLEKGEWEIALDYSQQANDDVMGELPEFLAALVKKAKPILLKAKRMNIDISRALKLVKEARVYIKSGDYMEAIKALRAYRQEVKEALEA
jgi:ATP/maltotriose-dependent transcriptional regulator MalT